jgi:hypothetical protein
VIGSVVQQYKSKINNYLKANPILDVAFGVYIMI